MPQMLMLPYRPVFDSNNRTVPGAQAWFTVTGTNTPTPVYTTSALNIAHSNPLIANGVGKLPKAYLNSGVMYRLRIYAENAIVGVDTPIEEYDPYIPGSAVVGSELIAPYADDAAAAAFTATNAATDAETAKTAAEDAATIATEAAAEAAEAVIGSSATLTAIEAVLPAGFTLEELTSGLPVNVKWFGAVADNVTDDGPAFAAALAYLKAHAFNEVANFKGSPRLFIPAGH